MRVGPGVRERVGVGEGPFVRVNVGTDGVRVFVAVSPDCVLDAVCDLKMVEVRLGVVRVGRSGTVWVIVEDGNRVMVPVTVIVAVGDAASDAAGVEEAVPMGIAVKVCGWKGVRLGMGELVIVEVLVEVGGST